MEKISNEKLYYFLQEVDKDYPVYLSDKVDLKEYTDKLLGKATVCFEEKDGKISGVVAGYTKNLENDIAYIALVGVINTERQKGIAKKLILEFINICKEKCIKGIHLYTDATNAKAIAMYKGLGFDYMQIEVEPRPNDIHFYLKLQ